MKIWWVEEESKNKIKGKEVYKLAKGKKHNPEIFKMYGALNMRIIEC